MAVSRVAWKVMTMVAATVGNLAETSADEKDTTKVAVTVVQLGVMLADQMVAMWVAELAASTDAEMVATTVVQLGMMMAGPMVA